MSDDNFTILLFGLGVIVSAFGWFLRRHVKKVDDIEKNAVFRPEFNATLQRLTDDIESMKAENRQEYRAIQQRLDTLIHSLAVRNETPGA